MSDGFLGRWSRRKLEAREGRSPADEPPREAAITPAPAATPASVPVAVAPVIAPGTPPGDVALPAAPVEVAPPEPVDEPPPPTMDDVQALTPQSDFSRFAAPDVAADVKNAALKKLFADPRYNVMDGMDVYIDDYSKPDPLPSAMVRQLAGAAFLRLFDEPPAEPAAQPRDVADNPVARSVAQSTTVSEDAAEPPHDADTDLRLQQDDAPGARGPGQGAA